MRISAQPIKREGRVTSWRFIYYDKEAKRPRYLKRSDHPEIASIKTYEQAEDFANKWNAKADEQKKKVRAKRKRGLYTEKFDFIRAIDDFKLYQKDFDKSYLATVFRVETLLNQLINIHQKGHPSQFLEINYRKSLLNIKEQRGITLASIRKYRGAFNKFLSFLHDEERLAYEQLRLIPLSTIKNIEKTLANKHGAKSVTLGQKNTLAKKKSRKKRIQRLTLKQLFHLLDFSKRYPDLIPERLARLFFIAGTTGLRRGALLALQRRNIEVRRGNRMYIVPDLTIQRYDEEDNSIFKIDEPDHIKDVPSEIPIWLDETRECIEWWLNYSKKYSKEEDAWLFPSDIYWSPIGRKGEPLPPGALPIYPDSVSDALSKCLAAAQLPIIKYKNLRHTYANILAELADIKTAASLLGHKSEKTTKKYYIDSTIVEKQEEQIHREDYEKVWDLKIS